MKHFNPHFIRMVFWFFKSATALLRFFRSRCEEQRLFVTIMVLVGRDEVHLT